MTIARLGYLGLQTQEAEAWKSFGSDLLGAMSVEAKATVST